ncbi:DUF3592 domain-containing protein [Microtetraspora fusca]|uniref:DUF3592 domain-containing protein n=1 Tax=Microtetraspora fusca TaxID=1997 RepID=A0ABW6VC27_MICFU|nr:DUF3592 domain-containing protein [Microtetraspora fusca]
MSESGIAVLVLGLLGVTFTLVGAGLLANARAFRRRALRAQGHVVGLRRSDSSDGVVFYPIVRFATAYGQPVEAESRFGSNPPSARPGQTVTVMYDPADPRRIRIDNLTGSGVLLGGIFLGVGLVLLIAGIGVGAATLL